LSALRTVGSAAAEPLASEFLVLGLALGAAFFALGLACGLAFGLALGAAFFASLRFNAPNQTVKASAAGVNDVEDVRRRQTQRFNRQI